MKALRHSCLVLAFTLSLLAADRPSPTETPVVVTGELRTWHKVTLDLAGPMARENDTAPNPFTDYRFEVTFTHESGAPSYVVPGYFAADGRAAETSATAGNIWRAHLAPDRSGTWRYRVAFTHGHNVAMDGGGETLAPYDGLSGTFTVAETNKRAPDFRADGRLVYRGGHYLVAAGTGQPFLKAGADAPETLLAYVDFDGTVGRKRDVPLKTWAPHVADWRPGDPSWQNGKGHGLIGAINYLAGKGANSISFLTYNAGGDGDNVWPFVSRDDKFHYDCSRLDQWGLVFEHAQSRGVFLHFKLQETENDDHRAGSRRTPQVIMEALDAGATGPERRLYFRELIARFGHNLALNWNLGEENTQTPAEQRAMADFIRATDPYGHHLVIHSYPDQQEQVYPPLVGSQSSLTGASLQNDWNVSHRQTLRWVRASAAAGRPWVVCNDEQGPANEGVPPDAGYHGYDGRAAGKPVGHDLHDIRKATLWGTLMAGGAGVEYYFGYQLPENDLLLEDFRSRDHSWDYARIALGFFRDHLIPLASMTNADELVGNTDHDNSRYCLAEKGKLYLVYLPKGGETTLDLTGANGAFAVTWFNPRTGGGCQAGTVARVQGGASVNLGQPPTDPTEDWLVVVGAVTKSQADCRSIPVGPNPESVTRGFGGDLFVTLMGETRTKGDGNGRIVRIHAGSVETFASGFDDPKGLVFTDDSLVTADFDRVWRIDANGHKVLLAGPQDFPIPPLYLNDVAIAPGGHAVLVTEMGAADKMRSPDGVLWPIDSAPAGKLPGHGRVYRISLKGEVSIAADLDPLLVCPNGVTAPDRDTLLVAEFFTGRLLSRGRRGWEVLAEGYRGADGIERGADGTLYFNQVTTGSVWALAGAGPPVRLAALNSAADAFLDESGGKLYVPDTRGGQLVVLPIDRP